ncbi:MAG: alkane 1-monooxygenase [Hyphomicrobiales bacterium]
MNFTLFFTAAALIAGSPMAVAGLPLALLLEGFLDERVGDTRRDFSAAGAVFLDFMLYLTLPLTVFLALCHASLLSSGDPLGLGWAVKSVSGYDLLKARDETNRLWHLLASLPVGFLFGAAAINVAHELFHRLQSAGAVITARWLLAFSCDTTFAIEHVHGHHRNVGTPADPATARRGESYYRFYVRSTAGEIANCFRLEANRLGNRGLPAWSPHNRALRGQLMTLCVAGLYVYAAGFTGLAAFLAAAAIGKAYLESTNYIEHYGLVRVPGRRVEARHSWDSYRNLTNSFLYNLPRHSDHHLNAQKTFWDLKTLPDAPQLPYGYQGMILLALIPRRFFATMQPLLRAWDETMASDEEKKLIASLA